MTKLKKNNKIDYNEDNDDINEEEIIILALKQTNLIKHLLFKKKSIIQYIITWWN